MKIQLVPLDLIDEPETPLRFDAAATDVHELAADIEARGLINPITVTPNGERFTLIAGHRRFLAHRMLHAAAIAASVLDAAAAASSNGIAIAENFQRADMSPMEEAVALHRIGAERGFDSVGIARAVKRSQNWVEQRLQLLDYPEDLQVLVHERRLPIASARALAIVTEPQHRAYLTGYALNNGATATTLRAWADEWVNAQQSDTPQLAPKPDLDAPAAPPVVYLPCLTCQARTPHTALHIVRVCGSCLETITTQEHADSGAHHADGNATG